MKRNLILVAAFLVVILLAYNSVKRIASFRDTSKTVGEVNAKLEELKKENEKLKKELQYKQSDQFVEQEIRDKLGLAKPGETVVILPQDKNRSQLPETSSQESVPNWKKWQNLFFGS